ncbi:MAG: hypothetical protein HY565_05185 [Candidatus Kerfeldbacteria bacterium]|nr:hypothetical protein [Candidatus Kerfeldbacteria bacterium]
MKGISSTHHLHFERLTLGSKRPETSVLDSTLTEYTADAYDKRVDDLDTLSGEQLQVGWQRLLEYGLVALAEVMPAADYQQAATQLTSPDLLVVGSAYVKLQHWCQAHTAEYPHLPMVRFIAATPPDLGYTINIFQRYGKSPYVNESVKIDLGGHWNVAEVKKLRQQVKQIPPPYQQTVLDWLNESGQVIPDVAKAALLLADGKIPAISAQLTNYAIYCRSKVPHTSESYRARVASLMPLIEAAIAVRGQRWQAEAPQHLRVLTKDYTELQWLMGNPLLGASTVIEHQDIMALATKDLGETTRRDARGYARLSWPLVLHKLCFDPARLERQWQASEPDVINLLYRYSNDDPTVDTAKLAELGKIVVAAYKQENVTDPVAVLREFLLNGERIHSRMNFNDFTHPDKDYSFADRLRRHQYRQGHPDEDFGKQTPPLPVLEDLIALAKQWFWEQRMLPLRQKLLAAVQQPDAAEKIQRLKPGFYRNLCLALQVEGQTDLEAVVAKMKPELGDGAEVNRSADIMNGYTKEQFFAQSFADQEWRLTWLLQRHKITADEAEAIRNDPHNPLIRPWTFHADELTWLERYKADKQAYQKTVDHLPASAEILLFSDIVTATDTTEAMVDPMYKPKFVAQLLLPELQRVATEPGHITGVRQRVLELMPEPCQFRDYFLDVLAQHELWARLQRLAAPPELAAAGIHLSQRTVDLKDHFVVTGAEVLADAYMERYDTVRVVGLAHLGDVLTIQAKHEVADFFTDQAVHFSPTLREVYERYAVDFEIDHLRADYDQYRLDGAEAFRPVLNHVLERFPKATHHRDSILFALMTDLATTEAQCTELEHLTYRYQVNHPGDFTPEQTPTFAVSETMKNYLNLFNDRKKRGEVLLWLVGGVLPDDRYIASKNFHVNEQDKVAAFWALSSEERRTIFYSALLGEGGLCDVAPFTSQPRPTESDPAQLWFFAEEMYQIVLEPAFADHPQLQKMGKLIFIEILTKYSAGRRVEFIVNLLDQLRELKIRDTKLRPGEGLAMVLQGLGIVGVKLGQVLSERPDLVTDPEIRADLAQLKDKREPFNKRGVFSYARSAKLFQAQAGQPQLTEIGECIGSASIKQAHDAVTTTGETVACKVERPNVARNLEEDLLVLDSVVKVLQHNDYQVPDWLVPEVSQLVRDELDFAQEVVSAGELRHSLQARSASITVGEQVLPIRVPQVLFVRTRKDVGTQRIQMIVEEKFQGLSIADMVRLQDITAKGTKATHPERRALANIHRKLQRLDTTGDLVERYLHCDVEQLQAASAIDLLYQVADDAVFHADPHDGNAIVDLRPDHAQYGLIDAGSVGHTETPVMRTDFLELTIRLMLLKQGVLTDTQPIARIMYEYTGQTVSAATWQEVIETLQRDTSSTAELFKQLVTKVLLVQGGKPDRNFRYLLKTLGSASAKFEALQNRLQRQIVQALGENRPDKIFTIPEVQKLFPLLSRIPGFDASALLPT